MTSRKIAPSGAGRKHAARGSLHLLPGGAGTEAPPDWSEGEGRGSMIPRPSPHPRVGFAPEDTERSVSDQESEMGERSWVRLDRFALADVRRQHGLTPTQAYLLDQLTRLADYRRPYRWRVTLHGIGEFTGLGYNTIVSGIDRLESEELIVVRQPFSRGHEQGTYEVLAYDELIVPKPPSKSSHSKRAPVAQLPNRESEQDFGPFPRGSEGGSGIYPGESLTRGVGLHDEALGGAYRRLREAFPGAEEVS